ncbi:lysophosphatidic acid phosphatase type 6 [Thecamonas trahens ATCC 50062]|uniref:Lysophosphatidic acid phosphatase type 6 n=1 Tax=Thecamonas trahens ATCC 50062 TaxID=461836 RepID=A0A0L0DP20_THETB|nr:lysophosphatidic acid phosphatase type 6 [Thecamonas trahens ATCC 50062]KNC54054.1 lysophosphatidic acid phosphatase type 6 [Thecamonas trahens ATCC 50062]|eukprot:XP_013754065.1 lysophosphatidic acid phosphatase type 6 [Thecamonas trahens ATCC 50062]
MRGSSSMAPAATPRAERGASCGARSKAAVATKASVSSTASPSPCTPTTEREYAAKYSAGDPLVADSREDFCNVTMMTSNRVVQALAVLVVVLGCVAAAAAAVPYCGIAPGATAGEYGSLEGSRSLLAAAAGKLVHVDAVFRHGDRTPANAAQCWPNDTAVWECELAQAVQASRSMAAPAASYGALFRIAPVPGKMFFPGNCAVGQLTTQGYEQHLANGAAFRAAYVAGAGLLPTAFDPTTVHIETDTSIRVQMSAQAFISGMYPDQLGPNAAGSTASLPLVNIAVRDSATQIVCPNPAVCPALASIAADFAKSKVLANFTETVVKPVSDKLAAAFGEKDGDVSLGVTFDCMHAHECHGFPLPPSVPSSLWADLSNAAIGMLGLTYSFPSRTEFGSNAMGPMIGQVVADLQTAVAGSSPVKMHMYGTHDTCIMPLLAALGLYGDEWCPYAGIVAFELYAVDKAVASPAAAALLGDDTHAVRLLRYGSEVTIPGCPDVLCPWSTFVNVLSPLVPSPKQCHLVHG